MLLYRNDTVEKNLDQIKVRLLYSTDFPQGLINLIIDDLVPSGSWHMWRPIAAAPISANSPVSGSPRTDASLQRFMHLLDGSLLLNQFFPLYNPSFAERMWHEYRIVQRSPHLTISPRKVGDIDRAVNRRIVGRHIIASRGTLNKLESINHSTGRYMWQTIHECGLLWTSATGSVLTWTWTMSALQITDKVNSVERFAGHLETTWAAVSSTRSARWLWPGLLARAVRTLNEHNDQREKIQEKIIGLWSTLGRCTAFARTEIYSGPYPHLAIQV
ncbi:hypothetical protein C8J57DRAFT_1680462 [Mycena rebaudengoi]|nr:hypothetical protein C8J57DRAFT_1680462 [Mycena rebaudengoi]